jgi:hypothetical protein
MSNSIKNNTIKHNNFIPCVLDPNCCYKLVPPVQINNNDFERLDKTKKLKMKAMAVIPLSHKPSSPRRNTGQSSLP